jgi:CHASE2 domain-containing sensor protein
MSSQIRHALVGMAVVVCCTAMSFGFSHIFPQGEQRLSEWQLSNRPSSPISSSIVLVRAEEKSQALCGEGRWDLNVVEATVLALHQAGASVIAPMIGVSVPIPAECGGLSGLVRLAELTKAVGSVVYPDSVPPALAKAAIDTGALRLASVEDGMVSGVTFNSSSLSSLSRPFGAVVAGLASTSKTAAVTDAFLYVPGKVPKKGKSLFPTYPFTDVWSLVQAGEQEKLVRFFQGKIVFLYSGSTIGLAPSTLRESNVPVALLHAKLANAYLTNAWVSTSPFVVAFLVTLGLGGLLTVPMFRELSWCRLGLIGLIIALFAGGLLVFGFHWGWIWPLCSMGLSVGMTIVGVGLWRFLQSRATVQERIAQREQQLTQLEKEFVGKQEHVRQLEEQLYDARHKTNQSVTVIEELQVSQNTALSQLGRYQDEMQETRRQMDRLQEELHDLRQYVPASPAEFSTEAQIVEDQELIQECEAFKILTRDQAVLGLFQNLILLLGETGTGKEVFAKAAHAMSPRRQGPFISVNMAAIRSELFEGELFGHVKGAFTGAVGRTGFLEAAHGGTLFLDEVGDLPLDLQACTHYCRNES